MEKVILKRRNTREKRGFRIKSGAIRYDGNFFEGVLFLKTSSKNKKGRAWAVRLIANDREVLLQMIDDYCYLYSLENDEIELYQIECKNVLTFRE